MTMEKALEAARCVEINLNNMVAMMSALGAHPLLPIVKYQIATCIKEFEDEEETNGTLKTQVED